MPIITEVRFAHEDGALADTLGELPELKVSVIPEASTNPRRSVYLMRFDDGSRSEITETVEADHTVSNITPMPEFGDDPVLAMEFANETMLLGPEVTRHDGIVLEAQSAVLDDDPGPRGWHERWLLPDRESLHAIWEHARDEGFDFEVLEFYQRGSTDPEYLGSNAPTNQQHEALVLAYERGYFAEPRETSLEELADELDLSPTAVAGRLKRGMRSLIDMTVAADAPDQ
jgi:hypothetical protein